MNSNKALINVRDCKTSVSNPDVKCHRIHCKTHETLRFEMKLDHVYRLLKNPVQKCNYLPLSPHFQSPIYLFAKKLLYCR